LGYKVEEPYIKQNCAPYKNAQTVKRDSCFDVAWLISEQPQSTTITQHSAYRATFELNSRYAQTMRTNIYAGVIRAELHRIGTDDNWYLQPNGQARLAVTAEEQHRRQIALVEAIANFIVSPTGAKVAAWAPHVFLNEGAVILTSARTAPFVSPIEVKVNDNDQPIRPRVDYQQACTAFDDGRETWGRAFHDAKELLGVTGEIVGILKGYSDGAKDPT
jgi:CRISPR-associated protein Cst2